MDIDTFQRHLQEIIADSTRAEGSDEYVIQGIALRAAERICERWVNKTDQERAEAMARLIADNDAPI